MLPAHNRMRTSAQFREVIRNGSRGKAAGLMVHMRLPETVDAADQEPVLVGFVVPKSVGNAVKRKRVQRQLRHVVREIIDTLPTGSQSVIRVFPDIHALTFSEMKHSVQKAVAKAQRHAVRQ